MLTLHHSAKFQAPTTNVLDLSPSPGPSLGPRHRPIAHRELAEAVGHSLRRRGYRLPGEYRVSQDNHNGARMLGTWTLVHESGEDAPLDYVAKLFVDHDNRQKRSLDFIQGAEVLVCSNGMVRTEERARARRKHTTGLELAPYVDHAVEQVVAELEEMRCEFAEMKLIPIDRETQDRAAVWFYRSGVLSKRQLGLTLDQILSPDHEEHADPTLWNFYQHANVSVKGSEPGNQARTLARLFDGCRTLRTRVLG